MPTSMRRRGGGRRLPGVEPHRSGRAGPPAPRRRRPARGAGPRAAAPVIAETGATAPVGSLMQIPVAISRFERYARARSPTSPSRSPPSPWRPPRWPRAGSWARRQPGPGRRRRLHRALQLPTVNMVGKIAPALAVGCTVVMKPPPQDPLCVIELARILDEVGFPPGVVNLVTGASPEGRPALVQHPKVDMVSFTGSTSVGQAIYAAGAPTMKRQLMELGGQGRGHGRARTPTMPRPSPAWPACGPSTRARSARHRPGPSCTAAATTSCVQAGGDGPDAQGRRSQR